MDSGRFFFSPPCNGNMLFLRNGASGFRATRPVMNMEETSKRRPFFSSPDELFDEQYYDEQLPEKKRRPSPEQVHLLEKSFETENKLEPDRKTQLAKKLGLQPRQVAVWFQNRRARWKNKQLERDYDHLKSSYDSLFSDHESILKYNEKLKAEVVSLTEKLQAKAVAGEPMPDLKPEPLAAEADHVPPLQLTVKADDRLSTGTSGSAVVDEDGPQVVDSGDSYFPSNDFHGCIGPMDHGGVHSEEDDGSGDGRGYFSHVLVAAADQQHRQEEGEPPGWWVWS